MFKPSYKISRKKHRQKRFFMKQSRISLLTSKRALFKFGHVAKKINLSTFLSKFRSFAPRAEKNQAIKRLVYLKTYRGWRHENWMPVRGQSARTNAKTRRKRGIH